MKLSLQKIKTSFLILISVHLVFACADEIEVTGTDSLKNRSDVFEQNKIAKADLIWVIDSSKSMLDKQDNLSKNFARFAEVLNPEDIDFHIGIISSDARGPSAGKFIGRPSYIRSTDLNFLPQFQFSIKVGASGSALEEGIENLVKLLDKENMSVYYPGFLREDAGLFIIFVSDEDDKSFGRLGTYSRMLKLSKGKGNESLINIGLIVGDKDTGCGDDEFKADPANRYFDFADLISPETKVTGSICESDFSDKLSQLGLSFSGLKTRFTLSKPAAANSLSIYYEYPCEVDKKKIDCDIKADTCGEEKGSILCNPNLKEGKIRFVEESNTLIFEGRAIPRPKAKIVVKYNVLSRK